MSTITHARLIDRLEFAAESAALRDRALAVIAQRREEEKAAVKRWIVRPLPRHLRIVPGEPKPIQPIELEEPTPLERLALAAPNKPGPKTIRHEGKTIAEWAEELGITYGSLMSRISRKGSIEAALAAGSRLKNQPRRGYEPTSQDSPGTGEGRHAHDLQSMEARP